MINNYTTSVKLQWVYNFVLKICKLNKTLLKIYLNKWINYNYLKWLSKTNEVQVDIDDLKIKIQNMR